MNSQQKWDAIIQTIEDLIMARSSDYLEQFPNTNLLSEKVFASAECYGLDGRAKNTIFTYMTGSTFRDYFDKRLDMYVYKTLLSQESFNKEELMNIAGVEEPGLIKRFQKTFNMTVTEAFNRKDASLYEEPKYWVHLSDGIHREFERLIEENEALKQDLTKARDAESFAKKSEMQARLSEAEAKESEKQARLSEAEAKESEKRARMSEAKAWVSELQARKSEAEAKELEKQARRSEVQAWASEQQANTIAKDSKEDARRSKLAYKNFRITILLLIAALVILFGVASKKVWAGDYLAFNIKTENDIVVSKFEDDTLYTIQPFKNRMIISSTDDESKIKVNFKRNSISWKSPEHDSKYIGSIFNDRSIICYEYKDGKRSDNPLRLVRKDDYEKWKNLWDGYYEVYVDSDGYSVQNGYSVQIILDESMFILSETLGEDFQVGWLLLNGPEHLVFTLPTVPEGPLQANLTGADTFTVTMINTDDVLFKCFRVLK